MLTKKSIDKMGTRRFIEVDTSERHYYLPGWQHNGTNKTIKKDKKFLNRWKHYIILLNTFKFVFCKYIYT